MRSGRWSNLQAFAPARSDVNGHVYLAVIALELLAVAAVAAMFILRRRK